MELNEQTYHRSKFILILFLVVSLPFHTHISSVIILAITSFSLIRSLQLKHFPFNRLDRLSCLFYAYFLLEIIGLIYTENENMRYGLSFLEKHHAFVLLPLIFQDISLDKGNRKSLFHGFVYTCFAACVICIISNIYLSLREYGTFIHPWRFSHLRLAEPIGLTPVYLSFYLGISIFILIEGLLREPSASFRTKGGRFFLLFIFLLIFIALGARTIIAGVIAVTFFRILLYSKSKKSFQLLAIAILIPVIFVTFIMLNPVAKTRFMDMTKMTYEDSNYGSYFARWKIWKPGIEAIKDNVWIGVGTGDHQAELDKKFNIYGYVEGVNFFNMHNQYLQTLLMHGLLGLFLLLSIFFVQIQSAIRSMDYLYLSFLILFILACLTESMLNRNKGFISFLLFSLIFYKSKKA